MSNSPSPSPNQIAIHSAHINEFYLSPVMRSTLAFSELTYMSGKTFKSLLTIHGTFFYAHKEYIVILPDCVKSKFFESPRLKLSLRVPKPEFGKYAYVLVRFA